MSHISVHTHFALCRLLLVSHYKVKVQLMGASDDDDDDDNERQCHNQTHANEIFRFIRAFFIHCHLSFASILMITWIRFQSTFVRSRQCVRSSKIQHPQPNEYLIRPSASLRLRMSWFVVVYMRNSYFFVFLFPSFLSISVLLFSLFSSSSFPSVTSDRLRFVRKFAVEA